MQRVITGALPPPLGALAGDPSRVATLVDLLEDNDNIYLVMDKLEVQQGANKMSE